MFFATRDHHIMIFSKNANFLQHYVNKKTDLRPITNPTYKIMLKN